MRIKSRPTVDNDYLKRCARMKCEKDMEIKASKALIKEREDRGLAGKREGRIGAKSRYAVLNAIRTEGREVMTEAGDSFWKDMKRRYPWQNHDGKVHYEESLNGRRNRLGIVKERYRNGRWEHWDSKVDDWVEGEVTPKKGIR